MDNKTGRLYVLRNTTNGKCYVGQTITPLKQRIKSHKNCKSVIGRAIRKYGFDAFEIIEFTGIPEHLLDDLETGMIIKVNSIVPSGYNIMFGGQKKRHAAPVSDETRAKMSVARLGRKPSRESIEKSIQSRTGQKRTDEQCQKMSEAGKAVWANYTESEKRRKSIATKVKELRRTEEGRQKIRDAHKDCVAWNKGKKLSDEHRKNLSLSHMGNESGHKGHKHSEETKQKMRESRRKYFERKAEEIA